MLPLVTVLTQDLQIFSGARKAVIAKTFNQLSLKNPKDNAAKKLFISSPDDVELEAWKFSPVTKNILGERKKVAIIFHGNNDPFLAIDPLSEWAKNLGYTTYAFHYRGYGRSNGWPSEKGLYLDAKSVVDYVLKEENVANKDLLFIGYSLGTPVAAEVASIYQPGILVLLAPFANLADVIAAKNLYYRKLLPFLWYEFATEKFIKEVKNNCFIIASGEQDQLVPEGQVEKIIAAYQEKNKLKSLVSPTAEHGNVFDKLKEQLTRAVLECEDRF